MGLELCFGLLLGLVGKERLDLPRLLDALSTRPARIAGIEPPALRVGARAELALLDPALAWRPRQTQLHSKSRNTPFMDHELKGKVLMTLARGEIAFDALGSDS
jgi:dihydroorotase